MKTRPISIPRTALIVLLLLLGSVSASSGQIAIVVHPDNELDDLSMTKLMRLYLGKQTAFEDGNAVALVSTSGLEQKFYESALRMSAYKVRRHWVKAVFAGSAGSPPESLDDGAAVCAFVASNRGALAFLDASEVGDGVKVVLLDGKRPGDEGYPLQ